MKIPSWRQNLRRRGGFWKDGRWYDLHVERRMPLAIPMLEEMVAALPPLWPGARICDLACGTGNAGYMVLTAYPLIHLTLLDEDPALLSIAAEKITEYTRDLVILETTLATDNASIPGGPYEIVLASLALHAIVGHDLDAPESESRYEILLQGVYEALTPGGHLIIGDHVGGIGLYRLLKTLERAGFADVDCAWRQDDFYVCGGRRPE